MSRSFVQWAVIAVVLVVGASDARAATFTVTSAADTGGVVCGAWCTLRQAIGAANAAGGADTIMFDAEYAISPLSRLPSITDPVTITGSSDGRCGTANGQRELLDGNGRNFDGFTFGAGSQGSRLCRFAIVNFGSTPQVGDGVVIEANDVTIDGNRIGVDNTGAAAGNNDTGILVFEVNGTRIGGPTLQERNVISDNALHGIVVLGPSEATTIVGNFIGLDRTGSTALGTQETGIIDSADSTGTVIGGTGAGDGNVISGNTVAGIDVSNSTVLGNKLGTDVTGETAVPNANSGIQVGGAAQIGGTDPGDGNLISGNGTYGVFATGPAVVRGNTLGPDAAGDGVPAGSTQAIGVHVAGNGVTVGGTAPGAGNIISGNRRPPLATGAGIEAFPATSGLTVQGNTIGLTTAGDAALGNDDGINLRGGSGAQIGGAAPGAGNIVAGNTVAGERGAGIAIAASETVIEGNTIGLDAAGDAIGNDGGIVLGAGAANTRIGGSAPGAGNVIGGHGTALSVGGFGVLVGADSVATTVQGNVIGLARDGSTARPNTVGIQIDNAAGAQVGGTAAGAGNVVSANLRSGIDLNGGTSTGVVIEGNRIGTDPTGTADRGNGQDGIFLADSAATRIGGTAPGAGNVISGNGFSGIEASLGAGGSVIQGNLIGTAADGVTPLGNDRQGVVATFVDGPLTIGGADPGAGNTIAANGRDGVAVVRGSGVSVLGNAIRTNGNGDPSALAIDLGDDGVTADDPGDADDVTHPNRLQNFPVLGGAVTDGVATSVSGTIDTTPGAAVRIELFSSPACDASGTGPAAVFLGAAMVAAGAGPTPWNAGVAPTAAGRAITATATDLATGDTSELSACAIATQAPLSSPSPPPPSSPALPAPTPPTPKNPAKLSVLRAGVSAGKLDVLAQITSRAATPGARLAVDYFAASKHTTFSVAIPAAHTGAPISIPILHSVASSQAKLGTGILTLTYAGNALVNADDVRLRAATGKSLLVRKSSSVAAGLLTVAGTLTTKAHGVVRIRLEYVRADASTGFLNYQAKVGGGTWGLTQMLPSDAIHGGELSIQFTGYLPAGLRGEQAAKQVLG